MHTKYGRCKLSLLMVVSFFFKFSTLSKTKLESTTYGTITDRLSAMCNFSVPLMDISLSA